MRHTQAGVILRRLRAGLDLTQDEFAEAIGVTGSFIAKAESGAAAFPARLAEAAAAAFGLGGPERAELERAAALSAKTVRIGVEGLSEEARLCAAEFAEALPGLSDGEAARIRKELKKRKRGDGKCRKT